MNADETKRTEAFAYKADRINDYLWLVKRFRDRASVPENFTNADYDECQVNISTHTADEAVYASQTQFAARDEYFAKKAEEQTQPHPGEFPVGICGECGLSLDSCICLRGLCIGGLHEPW